jgi:hypothetical protein
VTITVWLPIYRWQPKGRRLYDLEDLRDGQRVQAIAYYNQRSIRQKIKKGVIVFEYDKWLDGGAGVYLKSLTGDFKSHLGYWNSDGSFDSSHRNMQHSKIYLHNRFKENQSMANKLMALVKLNKNQRKLAKAGIYDENGNLTPDGQEVVLNLIAKDKEAELVELVKDWKTDKKETDDK